MKLQSLYPHMQCKHNKKIITTIKKSFTRYVESNQQWQWSCLAHNINGVWNAYLKEACEIIPQFEIPKNSMQQYL
jgi:hypothetical protein